MLFSFLEVEHFTVTKILSMYRDLGAGIPRRASALLLAAVFACFATLVGGVPVVEAADKMLVVSWDGVARRVLKQLLYWQDAGETPRACPSERFEPTMPTLCGEHLTCLPNLCRFQLVDSWDSTGKPLTKPQHAQMLSGYGPETTGVFRNNGAASMPAG